MDEVIPNLWLGAYPKLKRLNTNANRIQSILSILTGKVQVPDNFVHHQIPLDDYEHADLLSYFLPAIAFIQAELDQNRRVLVHCQAGISRSPTIVAAYLMYSRNVDRDAALAIIRKARPIISPNDGFMEQLDAFYKASFKVPPRKNNVLAGRSTKKNKNKADDSEVPDIMLAPHPPDLPELAAGSTAVDSMRRIRCKQCRQELATTSHLVRHGGSPSSATVESASPPPPLDGAGEPTPASGGGAAIPSTDGGEGGTPTNVAHTSTPHQAPASASALAPPMLTDPRCSGYFLDKMAWMEPFLQQGLLAGKMACPNKKCGVKLGNYDWSGVHCGCGEWITPAFCISRSKVDEIVPRPPP